MQKNQAKKPVKIKIYAIKSKEFNAFFFQRVHEVTINKFLRFDIKGNLTNTKEEIFKQKNVCFLVDDSFKRLFLTLLPIGIESLEIYNGVLCAMKAHGQEASAAHNDDWINDEISNENRILHESKKRKNCSKIKIVHPQVGRFEH